MGFENSVGVALGGIHVRHTCWGALYDVQQRCNLFGARLHACSMRKNQRAWVERWALRTVWAWPWGGSMCGTLVGEHFMMYTRCNFFSARLHACSMRKNQRAWVERWALRTVWAWPWGGSMCGTLVGEHFMMYNKGATCLGQGCMHVACGKIKGPGWNGGL